MAIFCIILSVFFFAFGGIICFTGVEGEQRPDEAIVALFGSSVVCFIMALAFCGC